MFGKGNDAPPPDAPEMESPQTPPFPVLRTFRVTRFKATERTADDGPVFETIIIACHQVAFADDDRAIFQTWKFDPNVGPQIGPQLLVTRMMTGVVEIEDITPAHEQEPNRIIH